MDEAVWVPTVFTKNRERLIKHDAVIAFFNEVVAIAQEKELLPVTADQHTHATWRRAVVWPDFSRWSQRRAYGVLLSPAFLRRFMPRQ